MCIFPQILYVRGMFHPKPRMQSSPPRVVTTFWGDPGINLRQRLCKSDKLNLAAQWYFHDLRGKSWHTLQPVNQPGTKPAQLAPGMSWQENSLTLEFIYTYTENEQFSDQPTTKKTWRGHLARQAKNKSRDQAQSAAVTTSTTPSTFSASETSCWVSQGCWVGAKLKVLKLMVWVGELAELEV